MRVVLVLCMAFLAGCLPPPTQAQSRADLAMVERGKPYFPLLIHATELVWPDAPRRSVFAAQVEKESLWNPKAELCVPKPSCSRERGIGFGQMTITQKFNVFKEVSLLHPALKGWAPKDYFDPRLQLIALVAKDRQHFKQCAPLMAGTQNALACMLASYNGGFGGFSADRRLCGNTSGCNPEQWFGHVDRTSLKAKVAISGYGQSFYQINRGYVCEVLLKRSIKYETYLPDNDPAIVFGCGPY